MIEDSIKYQTQGDSWLKRILIGGLLLFPGALLIIPLFTFNGYMLEVMRRVMGGDTLNPPEWGDADLADLTVDGLKHAVIVLAYTLVVLLVAGIPFFGLVLAGVGTDVGGLSVLGFLIGGLVYLVGALALAVVLPVATGNFVRVDSISAAFDLDVLRTLVTNGTMLKAVVFGFVVNVLMQVVSSILGITVVGYLAVPFLVFAGQSAIFYIWAEGFSDAYEAEYGEPPLAGVGGTTTPTAATDETWGTDTDTTVEDGGFDDGDRTDDRF
ncbi:DUF4013 domain-containing protein [Haloarcula sp. JP-L23]|uniref:DUF4013 domain-containing protein n=1 Tax=Haloarcula sp. JP-L23 TaxID=2716717 RepID=UPI00140F0DED|nr:DUF4013 domain-containing protein [Haloarcula sp. JP-L23]